MFDKMRVIDVGEMEQRVYAAVQKLNLYYPQDIKQRLDEYAAKETNEQAKAIFSILEVNAQLAQTKQIPICQDTGMVIIFLKVGQEVHFVNGSVKDAIHRGIAQGYQDGYLRKSIVDDPLFERINTKNNTPAIIHYELVEGEDVELEIGVKGFGSENMSKLFMLKPSEGVEGVKRVVLETIQAAGPNACPPLVVGIGIGGDFEEAAKLAKKATFRDVRMANAHPRYAALEKELLALANDLQIGPQGLGGDCSVLGLNIEYYPTHIAGMPVAVNLSCHVTRHHKEII